MQSNHKRSDLVKKRNERRKEMKRADITTLFPDATEEQINKIMDINGSDINNAKKNLDELQKSLADTQAELEAAKKGTDELTKEHERAELLQQEIDKRNAEDAIREMKSKISKETGIPAELLTETDEEACRAQAASIKEFATPRYPSIPDGGEPHPVEQRATRDQFAEWLNEVSKN